MGDKLPAKADVLVRMRGWDAAFGQAILAGGHTLDSLAQWATERGLPGESFDKAFVGYSLSYSSVDNVKKPTEGFTAQLTQTYVGWDYNFLAIIRRERMINELATRCVAS